MNAGDVIADVESTKAAVELEAPASGFLYPIVPPGTLVAVGMPLAFILPHRNEASAEELSRGHDRAVSAHGERLVSRRAQALLDRYALNPADIPGTGPIREADVEAAYVAGQRALVDWDRLIAALPTGERMVLLYGAAYQGQVVADCYREGRQDLPVAFVDDKAPAAKIMDLPVFPSDLLQKIRKRGVARAHVCISAPDAKLRCAQRLLDCGFEIISAIHPAANVSSRARIGRGVFLGAFSIVGTDAEIADFVQINNAASVAHHSRVGVAARLSDGARIGGNVSIGSRTLLGIGVNVNANITIGDDVVVVSGASVFDDVPGRTIVRHGGRSAYRSGS